MKITERKWFTLLLAIAILLVESLNFFSTNISALEQKTERCEIQALSDSQYAFEYEEGDLPIEKLRTAALDSEDIPDWMSVRIVPQIHHVNRLKSQEPDEYTMMFQNRDASKTIYIFSVPVKSNGNDLNFDEIKDCQNAIFSVKNRKIELLHQNHITNRFKKGEGKCIYDSSVGSAFFWFECGTILDVTEAIRAISGSPEGLNQSWLSIENDASQSFESGGVMCLSITYSDISGVFAIKSNYENSYLTNFRNTSMVTKSVCAYSVVSEWIFSYHNISGNSCYKITPLGRQWLCLGYDTSEESICVVNGASNDSDDVFWCVDIVGENELYFSPLHDASFLMGNGPNLIAFDSGEIYPAQCSFWLTNHRSFVKVCSISTPNAVCLKTGADISDYQVINPTNSTESSVVWKFATGNVLDDGDGTYQTIYETGVYTVFCEDEYSGVVSNELTVIVGQDATLGQSAKVSYVIRPLCFDSAGELISENMLTMGGATVGNTNAVTVEPFYNSGTNYSAKWTNKSQTFIFKKCGETYQIGATLSSIQYSASGNDVPSSIGCTGDAYSAYAPTCDYEMRYCTDVPNFIALGTSQVLGKMISEPDTIWHILLTGTVDYSNAIVNKYFIYKQNGVGVNTMISCLACNSEENESNVYINSIVSDSDVFEWTINNVGIDIPLIKQTHRYSCGYTTVLQVLYGANTAQLLNGITSQLHSQISAVAGATYAGTGIRMNQYLIEDKLNGTNPYSNRFPNGTFDRINYQYCTAGDTHEDFVNNSMTNTCSKTIQLIKQSLQNGWAPFMLSRTAGFPYTSSVGGAHYICIIGYESVSNCVLISNCHYVNSVYGIYAVNANQFYNSTDMLFYSIRNGG